MIFKNRNILRFLQIYVKLLVSLSCKLRYSWELPLTNLQKRDNRASCWLSSLWSTCQCRFDPWSRKMPTCTEQPEALALPSLTLCSRTRERDYWSHVLQLLKPSPPTALALQQRNCHSKSAHCNQESPLLATTRRKATQQRRPRMTPRKETHKIKYIKIFEIDRDYTKI